MYINESEGIVGNITINIRNDDCLLTINFSFSVFFHLYIFEMNIKSFRLSLCPDIKAYISITICRILIKLGESVGT